MRALDRVVIDTNVLLALRIFSDPSVVPLRTALEQGALQPVRSAATDAEWREVLARPGLFSVPPERQAALFAGWEAAALLVEVTATVPFRCRDPLDQKFLELAVAAQARWLVTRDKALLKLRRKARKLGLDIVTPELFAATWLPPATGSP
jgi:putative PIN family toxin of toxin-antitoxin system